MSPMHKIMKAIEIKKAREYRERMSSKRTPTPQDACDSLQIPEQ